nr:MAG TPA: restriction alleviation protein [Caudoviricetes sp.]
MDIVRRALLGDKKAQEELTEKGKLLPCPFCGNEKNIISNWGLWRVWCPICSGKADDALTRKDAIKAWNNRSQILTAEEMEMRHDFRRVYRLCNLISHNVENCTA